MLSDLALSAQPELPPAPSRRLPRALLALLALVLSIIAVTGTVYYIGRSEAIVEGAGERLEAIGHLKAQELARWLKERRGDAATLYYGQAGRDLEEDLLHSGSRQQVLDWLVSLARSYDYRSLMLLDDRGRSLLSFPDPQTRPSWPERQLLNQALAVRQVQSSGLYWQDSARLSFAVPLLGEGGRAEDAAAVVLLEVDAQAFLEPLLAEWPALSTSGRTLLARPVDDGIVLILDGEEGLVRLQPDSDTLTAALVADSVRLMAAETGENGSGAAAVVQGQGPDHRGRAVLATVRPVVGSDWFLVTQLEQRQLTQATWRVARVTLAVTLLLMATVGVGVWAVWQRHAGAELHQINQALAQQIRERQRAEERLQVQASYDDLTGLPNRHLFHDRLDQALARSRRREAVFAVLFLDLDRFKNVNDGLGHPVGDKLLTLVAERLRGCVRAEDTVARLGGDEFVILLESLPREELAGKVAGKVLESLAPPCRVEGYEFFVTASIGISLYPKDGRDREALLRNADTAMYHAKHRGRNNAQFYAETMNARSLERLVMENNLRYALERGELELYYQPQADLKSGAAIGLEALLRWRHPQLGMISPGEFIPLAEETGLIVPIGEWVLRTVCEQVKDWQSQELPRLSVAVNLSPRQFQSGLPRTVAAILEETRLDASHLELEITEGLLMRDVEGAIDTLNALKAMGLLLSIDDFGTGYSSLSYLKRFPLDRLKIDQSFVRDIVDDPDDAAIALAVIAMAHSLRLKVIAEGVETEGQLEFLRAQDCDEIQGYYLSRPLPVEEVTQWLRQAAGGAVPA